MKYTFDSIVRYSETDETGRMSIGALINLFQDTSTMHSESVDAGVAALTPIGQTWILASWQIEMKELPKLGEKISCRTWGYEFKDFYGYRNFTLERDGEVLAWANSVWVLFDFQTQRPVKIPADMIGRFGTEERYPMHYGSRKMRPVKGGQEQDPIVIGKMHLDTNHHVNNGQYVQFALNLLPEGAAVHSLRAEYRSQARLGDTIVPAVLIEEGTTTISLNNEAGKPYAIVAFA